MTKINATQGVDFSAPVAPSAAPEQSTEINFQYNNGLERLAAARTTKENVTNTLKQHSKNIELKIPFIGDDYIKFKGDGHMTYGQLREQLGIPPKVLSETNNQRLRDEQIVKDTKIYLNDIGWYEIPDMDELEGRDARAQRSYGNHYAGYERSLTNDEVVKILRH